MPPSKKKKTEEEKREWEESLQMAVIESKSQTRPNNSKIARKYGHYRSALAYRLDGGLPRKQAHESQQVLSGKQEILFLRQVQAADHEHVGLTACEMQEFAQDILDALGIDHHVGDNWPYNMLERHPWIRMLSGKPTDQNRTYGVSLAGIEVFFQRYEDAVTRYKVEAVNIWNMDETGIFIHQIGKKRVAGDSLKKSTNVKSGNSKEITTVVEAISAAGERIRYPLSIFKSKTLMTNQISDDEKLEWAYAVSYKGWNTGDHFEQWVRKIFIPFTAPKNSQDYRILIMDNHATHYSEELKLVLKDARVIPIYLPPHCLHLMQPLDVGVFKPVKDHYRKLVARYFDRHATHVVPKDKFIEFWIGSRNLRMTKENISSGFRKSGLWPIDKQMVLENPELTKKNAIVSDENAPLYDSLNSNLCINGVSGVVYPEESSKPTERNIRAKERVRNREIQLRDQTIAQKDNIIRTLSRKLELKENPPLKGPKKKVCSMDNGEIKTSQEVQPRSKKLKQDMEKKMAKTQKREPLGDKTNTS